jgi:hypothetical protein
MHDRMHEFKALSGKRTEELNVQNMPASLHLPLVDY